MGSVCCCFQGDDIENHPSVCSNCIPFNCCIPNFVNVYTLLFHREEDAPTTIEAAAAARTTTASATDDDEDDAFSETYHSPPRPLPYDVNPRNLDCLPGKLNKFTNDERLTEALITKVSPLKLSLSESKAEFAYFYTLTEDEDVCPTCLEEYTLENPEIVTKCSHNFHLGCIYEWMERSETCPVCGKVMMFDETT